MPGRAAVEALTWLGTVVVLAGADGGVVTAGAGAVVVEGVGGGTLGLFAVEAEELVETAGGTGDPRLNSAPQSGALTTTPAVTQKRSDHR
jgi:hypothetical protein